MLFIVVAMFVVLVIAGLVIVYAAYPHRGEEMPRASWLGEAMTRAADAAPVIEPEAEDHQMLHDREAHARR